MKLIRRLPAKGKVIHGEWCWGIFICPACNEEVKRRIKEGLRSKSCSCSGGISTWITRRKRQILNKYIEIDSGYKMELRGSNGDIKGFAIIDKEDYDNVSGYKWMLMTTGYVYCSRLKKLLHQFITGFEMTDHKDRDPLNNKRCNLRECSNIQNTMNAGLSKNNTSGFKGVHLRNDTKRWQAKICVKNRNVSLGCHDTKEEAAKAYNKKAFELYGEFAYLNVFKGAL